MFDLSKKCGKDKCYHCDKKIKDIDDLSIEHKTPWLHSEDPSKLFFDPKNIAFAHTTCNYSNRRPRHESNLIPCPSRAAYHRGCRCEECMKIMRREWARSRRRRGIPIRKNMVL